MGILDPHLGIEPGPTAMKGPSPSHWTTREFHIQLPVLLGEVEIEVKSREVAELTWVPLVAQMAKNPPPMQETWVRSVGWEDPGRRNWQPSILGWILAWRRPWTKEPGRLQSVGGPSLTYD